MAKRNNTGNAGPGGGAANQGAKARGAAAASGSAAGGSAAASESAAGAAGAGTVEEKLVAFAEQLGRVVGTVQAKAEGWLDPTALTDQLSQVRDSASRLLEQLPGASAMPGSGSRAGNGVQQQGAGRAASTGAGRGRSGGVVDAPGKKHRKPVANQPLRAQAADAGRLRTMKAVNANRAKRGR